ncbi:MAG: cytochrome c biogenesis protein ResB [Thermodesulfobacteriota bacterium]|nr:cytochrome c biogenesis protein ResB [Thermodesulfobacteriota bacterium]
MSLFLALAITSIFGTVIQQGLPLGKYEALYSPGVFSVLKFFNIFDMYHSWWFTLLLILLSVNIIACTAKRIPRIIKLTLPEKNKFDDRIFGSSQINKTIQCHKSLPDLEQEITPLLKTLVSLPIQVRKDDKSYFFSEKGRYSRMGFIFIHFSILLILGGGLIGAIRGFDGQMNIVEGKIADTIFLYGGKGAKKLGFQVRCDDFSIDFYKTGQPKEYRSDLTILENGKPITSKAIRVNHPLLYKGFKICQATYGIAGTANFQIVVKNEKTGKETALTLNLMEKTSLPDSKSLFAIGRFIPDHQNRGPAVLGVLIEPGKAHDMLWLFKDHNQQKRDLSFILKGFDTRYYTGIQVSRSPGVHIVWAGCILIMAGFMLSLFFIHTKVWLQISERKDGCEIKIAASVNRNRKDFEEKLEKLVIRLQAE